jgi:hypothetical protein
MHRAVAAWADRALGLKGDMNVWKMRRQRAAVDASLALMRRLDDCAVLVPFLFCVSFGSTVSISSSASCIWSRSSRSDRWPNCARWSCFNKWRSWSSARSASAFRNGRIALAR